jgi:ankyrin repeat protein
MEAVVALAIAGPMAVGNETLGAGTMANPPTDSDETLPPAPTVNGGTNAEQDDASVIHVAITCAIESFKGRYKIDKAESKMCIDCDHSNNMDGKSVQFLWDTLNNDLQAVHELEITQLFFDNMDKPDLQKMVQFLSAVRLNKITFHGCYFESQENLKMIHACVNSNGNVFMFSRNGKLYRCPIVLGANPNNPPSLIRYKRGMNTSAHQLIATLGLDCDAAIHRLLLQRDDDLNQALCTVAKTGQTANQCRLLCPSVNGTLMASYTTSVNAHNTEHPIHVAAKHGHTIILAVLLDEYKNMFNVNQQTKQGTPLMYAVRARHYDCCTLLLEKGAKPNVKICDIGWEHTNTFTALYLAVKHNHTEIASLLLSHGVMANIGVGMYEYTILYTREAFRHNNPEMVAMLVLHGATVYNPKEEEDLGTGPFIGMLLDEQLSKRLRVSVCVALGHQTRFNADTARFVDEAFQELVNDGEPASVAACELLMEGGVCPSPFMLHDAAAQGKMLLWAAFV